MIILIGMIFFFLIPMTYATPVEWHNMPKTGNDAGEIFQLRFEIKSDETTNYTITLVPGSDFTAVDNNNSTTLNIPIDATRTFIFNMKIENDLEDGKHPISYTAYKNGTQFKEDNIYVRVGVQTPGFELFFILTAIILAVILIKKRS